MISTYLMEYEVYDEAGGLLHKGKTKAKNKESKFAAKTGFGAHIEKIYGTNCKLVILTCNKCSLGLSDFGDIFGNFGDIFNPKP